MRCNDCNKFVSIEAGAVVLDFDLLDGLRVNTVLRGTITITGTCSECSTELLAYAIDVEELLTAEQLEAVKGHCCDLECEATISSDTTTITRKRFKENHQKRNADCALNKVNPANSEVESIINVACTCPQKELKPEQLDGLSVTGSIAIKCEKGGDELFAIDIVEEVPFQEMDEQ